MTIQVGRTYEVKMKNEREFGGKMRVIKVTPRLIEAAFEFECVGNEIETLKFSRRAPNLIRYKSDEPQFDAFPDGVVTFKAV